MTKSNLFLHYDSLAEFKKQYFKDLLTHEHLIEGQIKIDKLDFPDRTSDPDVNFWGYQFVKDGKKYLLSSLDENRKERDLKNTLPIRAKVVEKVANKGVVYYWIKKPVSARFKKVRSITFKQLINKLASLAHSNKPHQIIFWLQAFAKLYFRTYDRTATPPGFCKDSVNETLGDLLNTCCTIENPSAAKLEERACLMRWLQISEIVDISPKDWRVVSQFILKAAAGRTHITKSTRAYGNVGEVIDLSQFSISIVYNDITEYSTKAQLKYFDFICKGAENDRLPAFRLWGTLTEDFVAIKSIDIPKYVQDHFEEYKDLIYNIMYYEENYRKYIKGFDYSKLKPKSNRWKTNLVSICMVVDMYCDSQEEFDTWIDVLNEAMRDYQEMLKFPNNLNNAHEKILKKADTMAFNIENPKNGWIEEKKRELEKALNKMDTFIDKNMVLKHYIVPDAKVVPENALESYWRD